MFGLPACFQLSQQPSAEFITSSKNLISRICILNDHFLTNHLVNLFFYLLFSSIYSKILEIALLSSFFIYFIISIIFLILFQIIKFLFIIYLSFFSLISINIIIFYIFLYTSLNFF